MHITQKSSAPVLEKEVAVPEIERERSPSPVDMHLEKEESDEDSDNDSDLQPSTQNEENADFLPTKWVSRV